MTAAVTHVGLAAIGSASVAAHFGRLHGLTQGDGVGLVLFVYVLAVVVLRLAVLNNKNKKINIMTAQNVFRLPHQTHQRSPLSEIYEHGALGTALGKFPGFKYTHPSIYLLKTKYVNKWKEKMLPAC